MTSIDVPAGPTLPLPGINAGRPPAPMAHRKPDANMDHAGSVFEIA